MAIHSTLLDAWQFTRGIDVHSAQRVAAECGLRGDVQVAVLTTGAGWMRGEVVVGAPRVGALLFFTDRGMFEVTRRDEWVDAKGTSRRVLVMLKRVEDMSTSPEVGSRAG